MSTAVINRPYYPSLLLSPDESRDREGDVDLTVGGDTSIVAGVWGDGWKNADQTTDAGVSVDLSALASQPVTPKKGTMLVRGSGYDPTWGSVATSNQYVGVLGEVTSAPSIFLNINQTRMGYGRNATGNFGYNGRETSFVAGDPFTVAASWDGGTELRRHLVQGANEVHYTVDYGDEFTHDSFDTFSTQLSSLGSSVVIESVLFYTEALTDAEIQRISTMDEAWTWHNIGRQILRPQETELTLPSTRSHVSHIETVVFETDRDNSTGPEISGITNVGVDWDIDRAGSKARIDIATHKRVLRDGMWVAPYLRITPEVGDIQYQQMGHFRLGLPSTIVDGSVDTFGDDKVEQSATGGDIVDLLAQAALPFTFYTPANGLVMEDVRLLIKMATCGMMGPNIVPNGGFEDEAAGWTISTTTNSTSQWQWSTMTPIEGEKRFAALFDTAAPAGYHVAYRDLPVPQGFDYLYVMGVREEHSSGNFSGYLSARFFGDDGNALSSSHNINTNRYTGYRGVRHRHSAFGRIPDGAATVRLFAFHSAAGGHPGAARTTWDDIRVGGCTNLPIPDDRINLSPSNAVASTRIQTTGGSSIGYDAINADRLSAIGHHAIYTDLTGRLTTSPSRDIGSATVARTYGAEDYRLVGTFEVQRSANNRYNTVTAVKESFEEGVPPMFTTVWNDDPDDPWSVHHLGNIRYPNGPLMVQDAVDTEALEAAALATLARAAMQHTLRIQVLPDPTLTVHDVIEIVGGPEEAQGRWLVESLRPGTDAGDPVVEIGARRSLSSSGVSGVDMGGG